MHTFAAVLLLTLLSSEPVPQPKGDQPTAVPTASGSAWDRLSPAQQKVVTEFAATCYTGPVDGMWCFALEEEFNKLLEKPSVAQKARTESLAAASAPRIVELASGNHWPTVPRMLAHLRLLRGASKCGAFSSDTAVAFAFDAIPEQSVEGGVVVKCQLINSRGVTSTDVVCIKGLRGNRDTDFGSALAGHELAKLRRDGNHFYVPQGAPSRSIPAYQFVSGVDLPEPLDRQALKPVTPQVLAKFLFEHKIDYLPRWGARKVMVSPATTEGPAVYAWEWTRQPIKITFATNPTTPPAPSPAPPPKPTPTQPPP